MTRGGRVGSIIAIGRVLVTMYVSKYIVTPSSELSLLLRRCPK